MSTKQNALSLVLPFGQHRGQPQCMVPTDYLTWLLATVKLSSGLRAAVTAEVEARGETAPPPPAPKLPPVCCRCGGVEMRADGAPSATAER